MILFDKKLQSIDLNNAPEGKLLISTINANSYNISKIDSSFHEALYNSHVLIPDGVSVVAASRLLTGNKIKKVAGADLFRQQMERLRENKGKCFFLGSSPATLSKIRERAEKEYAGVGIYTYSPPYREEFTEEENSDIMDAINAIKPDVLFVGMTAPKQEKWAYKHFDRINAEHICCIGAVFDFYAGTVKRAPKWMIDIGMEWFYRLIQEPRRMWRRYLIGNFKFIWYVVKTKMEMKKEKFVRIR